MSDLDFYDYELPQELIAQAPLSCRTDARLMIVDRKRNALDHVHVRDLPEFLTEKDLIVLNDTKVIPARLAGFRTSTGGNWEGLFLRFREDGIWEIMSKSRGKLQRGEKVTISDPVSGEPTAQLEIEGRTAEQTMLVRPLTEEDPLDFLDRVGRVPIPPYIREGKTVPEDRVNYQTVYASHPGAVAAPTAGLHFTQDLLAKLKKKGIEICPVTLHVGAGTFKPISANRIEDHIMHKEVARITSEAVERIRKCRDEGGRIVAIGTTSVRVLESAANVKPDGSVDSTGQNNYRLAPYLGETDLFIRPPYHFKVVDVMLTNFHLPKSTLIILVRTFGGDDLIKRAYEEAIEKRYRFYSYGDAMLIL